MHAHTHTHFLYLSALKYLSGDELVENGAGLVVGLLYGDGAGESEIQLALFGVHADVIAVREAHSAYSLPERTLFPVIIKRSVAVSVLTDWISSSVPPW
jgi:hypothetical protein